MRGAVGQLRDGTVLPTVEHLQPALQYGLGRGYEPLVAWMRSYIQATHRPPAPAWDVCASTGNTDAFAKTVEALLNPGDPILMEHYVYQPILGKLRTVHARPVGVDFDQGGMRADSLEAVCAQLAASGTPARALYLIPNGQVRVYRGPRQNMGLMCTCGRG